MTLAEYVTDLRRRGEEAARWSATAPLGGTLRQIADELELLDGTPVEAGPALLSVAQLAAQLGRSPSTVRGWVGAGRFPGAFRLSSRDWRIPTGDVATFIAAQRATASATDLGAWRRERRA